MRRQKNELTREIARLLARLSEEALVTLAIVAALAYAQYSRADDVKAFLILLAALAGYLSLRVFNLLDRN